jgi:hypothetical protein
MGVEHVWHRKFDRFTQIEKSFIAERDSFYIATVSETGWPYVQHRGGPKGFLKFIVEQTLAFADYRGNLQYISTGNLAANDRACLFLMDYRNRARLKIYTFIEHLSLDEAPELASLVTEQDYGAKVERIFRLRIKAFDWNCPQHITPLFTEQEVAERIAPLHDQVKELENQLAEMRARGSKALTSR